VSHGYQQIRSYQRIFRPERRIYQVEGHVLPVPGGVPLRWLAYAAAALVVVLALSSGSLAVPVLAALGAAGVGLALDGRESAGLAGIATFAATWLAGVGLGLLDWPLRLVVVPVAVATFATQAAPDGRRADRFAVSWLALRLAPRRRSLGRALPAAGVPHPSKGSLWIARELRS
jgi:hypothetical protein